MWTSRYSLLRTFFIVSLLDTEQCDCFNELFIGVQGTGYHDRSHNPLYTNFNTPDIFVVVKLNQLAVIWQHPGCERFQESV